MKKILIGTAAVSIFGAVLTSVAAQITHIIACIKVGAWGFLIAGAILPPIGVIHGVGVWFGAWAW